MGGTSTGVGGWESATLRTRLNSDTIINSLENKEQIKQVKKYYIVNSADAGSVTTSDDKLWLLSCSEIWNNGMSSYGTPYGCAVAKEGERYKYYIVNLGNAPCGQGNNSVVSKKISWGLRSPWKRTTAFCVVRK